MKVLDGSTKCTEQSIFIYGDICVSRHVLRFVKLQEERSEHVFGLQEELSKHIFKS